MNESHIKIEIDEELLEDYTSGFYEESFESINENFFTLKRFNLVCEKVYDRVSAENGIFSYIIAYVREYLSFYERNDIISKIAIIIYSPLKIAPHLLSGFFLCLKKIDYLLKIL